MISFVILCGAIVCSTGAPTGKTDFTVRSLDYMANFGYYERPSYKIGQIGNQNKIRESIKSMQRFAGIPVTGTIDEKTEELIQTPRCGLPDMSPHLNTRKRRFTLQGTVWKNTNLTWKLINDNNDGLTRQDVESVLEQAFDKWHKITNLNFRKIPSISNEKVDIEVKFVRNYHDDPYPFDGNGGTLAHAFYPLSNTGLAGDVHFDDDETFTINSNSGRSLLWIAVHEIGHSIGLEHSNVKEAVMYPWYRGNSGRDFNLHADDKLGAQTVYGSRPDHPEKPKPTGVTSSTLKPLEPNVCTNTFKAVFLDRTTGQTCVINNDKIYVLSESHLRIEKGPIHVKKYFPHVETVDAAYEKDGKVILFSGKMYYIYSSATSKLLLQSGEIFGKYRGLPSHITKIDAAFVWPGNGRTYLFIGEDYYRYDELSQQIDFGYPRNIEKAWQGIPANIDAVFVWRNKATYFFKGTKYYRFNNIKISVEQDYPRNISPVWTGCGVGDLKLQQDGRSSASGTTASLIVSIFMVIVAKILN